MAGSNYSVGVEISLKLPPNIKEQITQLENKINEQNLQLNIGINPEVMKGLERLGKLSQDVAKQLTNIKTPDFNFAKQNQETQNYLNNINRLLSNLGTNNQVLKTTYDEFGKVNIQIRDTEGALRNYVYQWNSANQALARVNRKDTLGVNDSQLQQELQITQKLEAEKQKQIKTEQDLTHYIDIQTQKFENQIAVLDKRRGNLVNSQDLSNLNGGVLDLKNVSSMDEATKKVQNLQSAMKTVDTKAFVDGFDAASSHSESFGKSIETAAYKMGIWLGVGNLFFGLLQQIKQAFAFLTEVDTRFTTLQMEMTNTNLNFSQLTKTANDYALAMGSTTSKVVEAIDIFGNYNSTLAETLQRSQAAVIMSNITGDNMKNTSDAILSMQEQFGYAADKSLHLVDILMGTARQLQVDFPDAVKQTSEGIKQVGSVANDAGVPLEKLSGMIGTVAEKTRQTGDTIGNAYKTIFSRMSAVSDSINPADFSKIEKAFDKVGIAIKSSADTIKPLSQVFDELGAKWNTLDQVTKNNIATDAAGIRQKNIFLATMNNYAEVLSNTTGAENSQGLALQKNEIYLNSIQGKVNQFITTLQKLYMSMASSTSIKGLVDLGTGGLEAFSKLTNIFGTLPTLIGAAAVAVSLFSKNAREGFLSNLILIDTFKTKMGTLDTSKGFSGFNISSGMFSGLTSSLQLFKQTFQDVNSYAGSSLNIFEKLSVTMQTLRGSTIGATVAMVGARIATVALQAAATMFISLAVSALVSWISNLKNATEKQKQLNDELNKSFNNEKDAKSLQSLAQEYENLSHQTSLTTEQKQKFRDIQQKIADLMPDAIKKYDLEGNAVLDDTNAINKLIEAKNLEAEVERRKAEKDFYGQEKTMVESLITKQQELNNNLKHQQAIEEYIAKLKQLPPGKNLSQSDFEKMYAGDAKNADFLRGTVNTMGQVETIIKRSSDTLNIYKDNIANTKKEISDTTTTMRNGLQNIFSDTQTFGNLSRDQLNSIVDVYVKNVDKLQKAGVSGDAFKSLFQNSKEFQNAIKSINDDVDKYNKGMISSSDVDKTKANSLKIIGNVLNNLKYPKDFINGFKDIFNIPNAQQTANDIALVGKSIDDLMKTLKPTMTNIKDYNQILFDMANGHKYTGEEVMKLAGEHPALLNAIVKTAGGYIIETNAVNAEKDAEIKSMNVKLTAEQQKTITEAQNVLKRIGLKEKEIAAIKTLDQAMIDSTANTLAQQDTMKALANDQASPHNNNYFNDSLAKYKAQLGDYSAILKSEEEIRKIAGTVGAGGYGVNTSAVDKANKTSDAAAQKAQKASEAAAQAAEKHAEAIAQLRIELDKYETALDSANRKYNEENSLWSRKIQIGFISGFDVANERIKILDSSVNNLLSTYDELNKQSQDWREKQAKYDYGSQEWNMIQNTINKINAQMGQTLQLQKSQLAELNSVKSAWDSISKTVDALKQKFTDIVSKIKDISTSFTGSITDMAARLKLDKQFSTDVFGKPEDLFNSITDAYKQKMLDFTKMQDEITKVFGEKAKTYFDLLKNNPNAFNQSLITKEFGNFDDINAALKEYGLTQADIIKMQKEFNNVLDVNKKYDETKKYHEDLIKQYQDELKALDKQNSAEQKILDIEKQINDVKTDKRFEKITETGERIYTYDQAKVNDLEKQLADEQLNLKKQQIQDKIDAEQNYLDNILPKQRETELQQYDDQWSAILNGQDVFLNKYVNNQSRLYPNYTPPPMYTLNAQQPQQLVQGGTTVNINGLSITGEKASAFLGALQNLGLAISSS